MPEPDLEQEVETTTETPSASTLPAQPSSSTPPPAVDWEKRFKGLQAHTAKEKAELDTRISSLQTELTKAMADLEGARASGSSLETEKTSLAERVTELSGKIQEAEQTNTMLSSRLGRQAILMKEFPQLAPFTDYIQPGETEEQYRENLAAFQATLGTFVDKGVSNAFRGAVPPASDTQEDITGKDLDAAYDRAASLAGVPGKEKEYAEARDEWEKLSKAATR